MNNISVYIASPDNPYVCEEDQIYIATEENLKNQIRDAERVHELAQKENLTYLESKELRELSRAVMTRAKARLEDLYPPRSSSVAAIRSYLFHPY